MGLCFRDFLVTTGLLYMQYILKKISEYTPFCDKQKKVSKSSLKGQGMNRSTFSVPFEGEGILP